MPPRNGGLPICAVTGRIAGDSFACGDCDPCVLGAHKVPEVVQKLMKERDEFMNEYSAAKGALDMLLPADKEKK